MTNYSKSWTVEKQRESNRASYHRNKEARIAYTKARQQDIKREVLTHYSHGSLACACCGESVMEFLSLDHIDGGGAASRLVHGSSYRYYAMLKRKGYPEGYRVLCHNCNQATSWGRTCPHELLEANQ